MTTSESIADAAAVFHGNEKIRCPDLEGLTAASAVLAARAEISRRQLQAAHGREVVYLNQQMTWRGGWLEAETKLGYAHPLDGYVSDDGHFRRFQT